MRLSINMCSIVNTIYMCMYLIRVEVLLGDYKFYLFYNIVVLVY